MLLETKFLQPLQYYYNVTSEPASYRFYTAAITFILVNFWKHWKSKFEEDNNSTKFVGGKAGDSQMAEAFSVHVREVCTITSKKT